jgi:nucleoside-diphosphate-sugar epimerase
MTVVLVTGASGFVGKHAVAALTAKGLEVVAVDHRWESSRELEARVGDRRLDACLHLGWYAAPEDYLTAVEPNLRSLSNTISLARALPSWGCSRLVVAGSSAEYAGSATPLSESGAVGPWSAYGASKAAAHQLLASSLRPAELALTWTRLFNVTGPGESPQRLLPWVCRELRADRRVALTAGHQLRDFLDVTDVADALSHLVVSRAEGTYNICSGVGRPLRELIEGLGRRLGREDLLDFGGRQGGPHDALHVVGDAAKLRATGWAPTVDSELMLDRVVTSSRPL